MAHFQDGDTCHDACCETTCSSCSQILSNIEFQRGIWGAAMNGDMERVEALLSCCGVSPNAKDSAGYTALRYAARKKHYQVCQTLLQHGADVNARSSSIGRTALHHASTQGYTEIVNLLLEHNADANLRDADGKTPLHRVLTDVDVNLDICKLLAWVTDPTIEDNSGRTVRKCFRRIKRTIKSKKDQKEKIAYKAKLHEIEGILSVTETKYLFEKKVTEIVRNMGQVMILKERRV